MTTLRDEIDDIIYKCYWESNVAPLTKTFCNIGVSKDEMLDKIMYEIDKDKEAMCEECPGNHLK